MPINTCLPYELKLSSLREVHKACRETEAKLAIRPLSTYVYPR
jgi:hypothetical protein